MDKQQLNFFCNVLLDAQENLVKCSTCCAWQEKERSCLFCSSKKRCQDLVCVVESWQELLAIEKTGGYDGVFHVLGGVICPLEGIGPESLSIDSLVDRVDKGIKEVILATNQTPEGETTAAYIANKLKNKGVLISCLARGVPVGSTLEFVDRLTMYKALSERRPF